VAKEKVMRGLAEEDATQPLLPNPSSNP